MKKLILIIFLLCGMFIGLKSFAIEEKKNIAVFPLTNPINASSYAIYSGATDMFSADLVNALHKYSDLNIIDISTSEKIIQVSGLQRDYDKLTRQYKQKYTIDYDKLDKIAQTIGVDYVVFVYGGFDTEKDFLKSNWKFRCQWIWANPVSSSAELNINSTLIDVHNRDYILEDNARKDISMNEFQKPSSGFGENIVPISKIKKFTRPTANLLANKIHSKIYPNKKEKFSQKDAFVDKFTPNNQEQPNDVNTQEPVNNTPDLNNNVNLNNATVPEENFENNIKPAVNSTNSVNYSRTEKYKNWIQQKL
ncbi:MAG: hypothetical protein MJ180_01485 [Candidatus Gastranaerophilales bacterium]|nr:hypothetical protein [Candidatus Gastranaerophilales bacterium]